MPSFPVDEIRARFPAVSRDAGRLVYLDNPAGTQLPGTVIEAVAGAMTDAASNLGGCFPASQAADAIWQRAHAAMADLLAAGSPREVVIGPSMTALTFAMSRCLGRRFAPGDEIVVTRMDHEGNVSPWLALAEERDLVVRWLDFDRDSFRIEPEALAPLLNDRTRLLALNHASNLTGSINDVASLGAMAREAGALVYVDAVQYAPHGLLDVRALGCDFLVCSSYKFFGPHLGILWGREDLLAELAPYKVRCGSDALPERFETGTPQTELLAGLEATVEHIAWTGAASGAGGSRRERIAAAYQAAHVYEQTLATHLIDGLGALAGVTIHGITNPNRYHQRVPTVSFTHAHQAPADIVRALADDGVCVWAGHNYAWEVVRHLGLDERHGVVRIGIANYNTLDEINRTVASLARVLK